MKIFSSDTIRKWDQFTIEQEPIASIDLMERAAKAFTKRFLELYPNSNYPIYIFCGPGNNGGDGLAIGRLLHHLDYEVHIFICEISAHKSADFQENLERLPGFDSIPVVSLIKDQAFPILEKDGIVIDAIFGSGLSRAIEGYWANLLDFLNTYPGPKVAIDIPSGVYSDQIQSEGSFFDADTTISFQSPKLSSFFKEENDKYGNWYVEDIGLHPAFSAHTDADFFYLNLEQVRRLYKKRKRFSHKGTYGHALVIAGSFGMLGAAQLCARAALRIGAGLVSLHLPQAGFQVLQTACPEVMLSVDQNANYWSVIPDQHEKYQSIGIGPGLGQASPTQKVMIEFLQANRSPLVIDADALNILAQQAQLNKIPKGSILTPHPGEFRRLFGDTADSMEELKVLKEKATAHEITIILKGAYSRIALPDGRIYFNSTGNPGMATAGSGDVLTGIITGLLAQGYTAINSALLGVFLHGLAGDIAAEKFGEESLIASDIIANLPKAYRKIRS